MARVARTMLGSARCVAVAEPLADAVRETLAAHGLSAVGVAVAEDPGSRRAMRGRRAAVPRRPAAPRPDSRHPSSVGAGERPRPGDCRAAGRQPRRDAGAGGDRQREGRRRARLGDRHPRPLDAAGRAVPARVHRRPTVPAAGRAAHRTTSTSSTSRFAPARRSPSSTATPTRSSSNCRGTPPLSRRSSRAGIRTDPPTGAGVPRRPRRGRRSPSGCAASPGKVRTSFIGVLLDARRRVGALESFSGGSPIRASAAVARETPAGFAPAPTCLAALVDSTPSGPCCTTSGMVNAGIAPPNSRANESAVTNMSRPASGRAASWISTTSTAPDSMSSAR